MAALRLGLLSAFATNAFASHIVDHFFSPLDVEECNWTGMLCNANGNGMQIALPKSNLVGFMPRELYFLTDLTALNFSSNAIQGATSSDIQLLSNLESVNVSGIFQVSGNIPTELGLLSSTLNWLDLSENWLTGAQSTELGRLTRLEHLGLRYMYKLTGRIATELGLLSNLPSLTLGKLPFIEGGHSHRNRTANAARVSRLRKKDPCRNRTVTAT